MQGIDWTKVIETAISTAIVVLVPLFAAWITGLISSWRSKLAVEADDAWYEMAAKEASVAVLATFQGLVDDFKAASKDGKLTEDERAAALQHAMDIAKTNIGTIPAHIRPKFESWLRGQVEAAVAKFKLNKAAQQPVSLPTNGGVQTAAPVVLQTR